MKKQLIKEITDINKLIKNEQKNKLDLDLKLESLELEINSIEEKFKSQISDSTNYENYPKISKLKKLYETSLRKNQEKTFIQYNLSSFQKENELKVKNLQKKIHELIEKENKNQILIEKKIEELNNEITKAGHYFSNDKKQEKYIISPETMSLHMISKINSEIDFMKALKEKTHNVKTQNEQILTQIENNINILNSLKSKKDRRESSYNETSTAAKISSHKYQFISPVQIESAKIINTNPNNNNNINYYNNNNYDVDSSMSLEIETDINLDSLPSNDESLRFIDKVCDIKSKINPIKNNYEEKKYYPPSASIPKEQTRLAQPIKVEKPLDYKIKNNQIEKDIEDIKKEIEDIKTNIENFKEKRKKIEDETIKKEQNLKHACTKIKIINDQIKVINEQINEFEKYKQNHNINNINNNNKILSRIYSIYNIINTRNFYLYNSKENNNNISNKNTIKKK